jgi:hypothetical protein
MKRFAEGVCIAAVIASFAFAWMQHREITRLTAEKEEIRKEMEKLQTPHRTRRGEPVPSPTASAAPSGRPEWFAELLRLRSENGARRKDLAAARTEMARLNQSLSEQAEAAKTYFPKSAWATAGNATPEAALLSESANNQSPAKLARGLNREQLQALIKLMGPAEQQSNLLAQLAGLSDAEVASKIEEANSSEDKTEGICIVNKRVISDDEVELTFMTFYNHGTNDGWSMGRFKRVGNAWTRSN